MTTAMDELSSPSPCDSVASSTRLLPHELKRHGARDSLLLRAVGIGHARPSGAQEIAGSVPARVLFRWLASDPGVSAALPGSVVVRSITIARLRGSDGREIRADLGCEAIPHEFPTAKWRRPIKRPCQGAILIG